MELIRASRICEAAVLTLVLPAFIHAGSQYFHILYKFNAMRKSHEITFVLQDGTDVFIDLSTDGTYHIRYIMPNGLPNVVLWRKDGNNDAFFDSNALEAIEKLMSRL